MGSFRTANAARRPRTRMKIKSLRFELEQAATLGTSFAPHHVRETIKALHNAQPDISLDSAAVAAEQVIHECDTTLTRYREALEAGTDPTLVAPLDHRNSSSTSRSASTLQARRGHPADEQ